MKTINVCIHDVPKIGIARLIVALLFVLASAGSALATTRYAKTTGLTYGLCDSWAAACGLTQAINAAAVGDEVWVESGTYAPIALKNGVKVIGGFAGSETAASQSDPIVNVSIIDGNGNRAVESHDNGPTTVLRGFTIKNGRVTGFEDAGGGLFLSNSAAMIAQCVFQHNTADFFGGAVAITGASSVQFINCTFRDNGAMTIGQDVIDTIAGAGVYIHKGTATFTNCLFHGNKSGDGGAIAIKGGGATINNCTIALNEASVNAGGGVFDQDGAVTIKNSIIWGNAAGKSGAQIFNAPNKVSTVTKSNVQGGYAGTGNIDSDPLFVNGGAGNFTLQDSSPCKNQGQNSDIPFDVADIDWDTNTTESIPLDLKLENRKTTFIVDMGCYEVPLGGGAQ